jgi:hypothetical protein
VTVEVDQAGAGVFDDGAERRDLLPALFVSRYAFHQIGLQLANLRGVVFGNFQIVKVGTGSALELAKAIFDLGLAKHLAADQPMQRWHESVGFFEGKEARLRHGGIAPKGRMSILRYWSARSRGVLTYAPRETFE